MTLKYEHLIGRPFTGIGKNDCFRLFQDIYRDNFEINITNYGRPHDWDADKLDLMELCHEREGFEKITEWRVKDLRPGDVLCMAISSSNPNHFAVYVGDSLVVHHLYGKFSSVEPFRDFFRLATCYVLRHRDVPDLRPTYPDVDIMSLINARNAAPTG